jgi:hypothetical protein
MIVVFCMYNSVLCVEKQGEKCKGRGSSKARTGGAQGSLSGWAREGTKVAV